MDATTAEAVQVRTDMPGRRGDAVQEAELSAAALGDWPDSRAGASFVDPLSSDWRDLVDAPLLESESGSVADETLSESRSGSQPAVDELLGSLGFQPEAIDELLSLTLDGMLLESLNGDWGVSDIATPFEEIPGRFPTYMELLCREVGYTDSFCRQRYGY